MYYGFNDITFTDNHDEVTTPLRTMNVHDRVFQRHPSKSHNDHIVRKLEPKNTPTKDIQRNKNRFFF